MRTALLCLNVAVLSVFTVPHPGTAQVLYGSIVGTVEDPSGGRVPGAKVTVNNQDTALVRHSITHSDGEYVVPDLPIGTYTVIIVRQDLRRSRRPIFGCLSTASHALTPGYKSAKLSRL